MGLKSIRFTKRGVVKGVVSGSGNSAKRGYNGRKKVHAHHVCIYGPIISPFSCCSIWFCLPFDRFLSHARHCSW